MKNSLLALSLLLVCLLSGCAGPVGVVRISPEKSYRQSTTSSLGMETISNSSKAVLHRYNLQDRTAADLPKTITLLADIIRRDDRRDLLFTMAEISYLSA